MSIEILSPCGSKECVLPAVSNGADAIYLGMKEFSARKDAQNFDFEELSKTISYCHRRGVKVYLALNTVVFDKEMASALEIVCKCRNMGIDALIVQDLGLVREVKKLCPDLPLHASTQMSVHTLSGAKLLSKLGFKRVVLAREMSLSEIAEICENVDIETEVFVHGANCMCVSGQCYMSSMIGTRSGNRGACAQPCRKPYKIEGNEGYPLSLKDNSSIEHILDLQSLGVTSVKIEGRMKRPEYVAVSTRACFLKREQGFIEEETKEQLKKVFSRTGFTDGYIKGKLGKDMFGFRQKRDVLSADEKLYKNIRSSYKTEIKRFGVSFDFYEKEGFPYLLATNFENSVEIKGSAPFEEAINTPLTKEKVFSLLKKLGGTPFMCKDIRSDIPAGKTVSASVINEMRRKALEFLLSEREKSYIKKEQVKFSPEVLAYRRYVPKDKKEKRLNIKGFSEYQVKESDFSLTFVPLFSSFTPSEKIGVEIPRVMFGKEKAITKRLSLLKKQGLSHILCHNLGAVQIGKDLDLTIHGGFGLNVCNTSSLLMLEELGVTDAVLSIEMTFKDISALGGNIKRGLVSGDIPLMISRNCPKKSMGQNCKSCKKQDFLQDSKNYRFRLFCYGNYVEILNSRQLKIPDENIDSLNIDFHINSVYVENYVEKVENLPLFLEKKQDFTLGLYKRGVK